MFSLTRSNPHRMKRGGSQLALAIALASGAVLGITAMEAPAYAAKKDKKPKEQKADYSKEWLAAYTPLEALTKAEPKDIAAIKAGIPAMASVIQTNDDKFAGGNFIYAIGVDSDDRAMMRQGVGLMLDSGKVPAANVGQYNYLAAQLAYQDEDWSAARTYFTGANAAGYGEGNAEGLIAETYFSEENNSAAFAYIKDTIGKHAAAGTQVDEALVKRGLSVAYKNDMVEESHEFAGLLVKHFPSTTAWGDAIAIQRNLRTFDNQQTLDLMRLGDRTGSLRNERDYVEYVDAADARRLPGEVSRVIEAGIAAGQLNASDVFISEARSMAKGRISADQAELPALERDARKASSTALTASAAGDAFLSYGRAALAEEMYTIALSKDGADTQRVLTRLGIAQLDQGKAAEAKATFAKVNGPRRPIADLWAIYADEKSTAS